MDHAGASLIEYLDPVLRWAIPKVPTNRARRAVYLCAAFARETARDQVPVRAATLAYWTLVTIVPVLVLGASILRPFGLDGQAYAGFFSAFLSGSVSEIGAQLDSWLAALSTVDIGKLGVVGVIGALYASSRIYFSMEDAYNTLWNTRPRRAWATRFIQYYTTVTLAPLLIATGFHYSAILDAQIGHSWAAITLPVLITMVAFVGAIRTLPDADVHWGSAILGGLASAILFEFAKVGFNMYVTVFGAADSAAKIYGAIWFIPVFLFWLYLLWMIVLFGVELAYVVQRREDLIYAEEKGMEGDRGARRHADALFGLQCLMVVAERYAAGLGPSPESVVTHALHSDPKYVLNALETLEEAGVLGETPGRGYLPALPLERLTVREVVTRYRKETLPNIAPNAPGTDLIGDILSPGGVSADQAIADLLRVGN